MKLRKLLYGWRSCHRLINKAIVQQKKNQRAMQAIAQIPGLRARNCWFLSPKEAIRLIRKSITAPNINFFKAILSVPSIPLNPPRELKKVSPIATKLHSKPEEQNRRTNIYVHHQGINHQNSFNAYPKTYIRYTCSKKNDLW